MTTMIRLTGRVIGWDEEEDSDEHSITASETESYEAKGYLVCEIADKILAMKSIPFEDGIIQLQPKSDMLGRFASSDGHTNYGYSGYFKAYVYLKGKRKALVDFWSLFPGDGHHYSAQQDKAEVEGRIRVVIEARAGTDVIKVARGYAFDPTAHAERQASKGQ